jgi:hypothetical protein
MESTVANDVSNPTPAKTSGSLKINRECLLPSLVFGHQTIRYPLEKIMAIEREMLGSKSPIMTAVRKACEHHASVN